MRSEKGLAHYFMQALHILFVLLIFVIFGCKGKEVKEAEQTVPEPPVTAGEEDPVAKDDEATFEETLEGSSQYASVTTANTAPRITVLNVYPPNPVAGDTVKIDAKAFDREGDSVNFTYQWWKNDEELTESSDQLAITEDFRRGDKITVKIIPDDGERKGTPVELFVFIANSPPVIVPSAETFRFDGSFYSYQARATDPDGDPLVYSLKASPPGMTINKDNGQVQWNVPPGYEGKATIIIAINDGHGGEILQSFTLDIRPEFM